MLRGTRNRGTDRQERPSESFEVRRRPPGNDPGRTATVVFGLVVIAIGLWLFAERTLDIDLPEIDWGALWPLAIIGLGAWILIGAADRRR